MSSECVCHISETWCFYCEMYKPLERKYESAQQEREHYFKLTQSATADNEKLRQEIEQIKEILKNEQRAHWQIFKIRQLLGVKTE